MPKEPPDFDCRDAVQVLRLRLRDWMWPTALMVVMAIVTFGYFDNTSPYRIGSLTYYVNTFGPILILLGLLFAGLRWCLLGRLRPHDSLRCAQCNYPLDWSASLPDAKQCPECGTSCSAARSKHRAPFTRRLLDLPGLLAALFAVFVIIVLVLASRGVIDFD